MNKKTKYRATSAVITCLVIAVAVVFNILVGALGTKVNMKLDLTQDKVLEFSDQTIETLKNLDKEVTIYSLLPEDNDVDEVYKSAVIKLNTIVEKYQTYSSNINYVRMDADKSPTFLQQYQSKGETLNGYSVVIECGDKFKVVDINSTMQFDQNGLVQSLNAEQLFTSAILYVSSDIDVKAAVTTGHGEVSFEDFDYILSNDNYETVSINLAAEEIGDDVSLIIIASPQTDFLPEEIEKLSAYFEKGGKVQVLRDVGTEDTPNFDEFLKSWGVEFQSGVVIDTNANNYIQTPLYILPKLGDSVITSALAEGGYRVIVPVARGISVTETEGIYAQTLMSTSESSLIKLNLALETAEKEDGDIDGPAVISAYLTKQLEDDKTAELMVMGNTYFLSSTYTDNSSFANKDFYLNSVSVMSGNNINVNIRAKDVSTPILSITEEEANVYAGIVVLAVPLIILIFGIVIWIRRRHL